MTSYQLKYPSLSGEQQIRADALSQQLVVGAWEATLTQFVEFNRYQALLVWIVNFPFSDDPVCLRCLSDMRRWVAEPEESLRWQIFEQAQAIGFSTVVGALGLSLFWSQGSMTAAEFEPVYPQPHLSGLMLLNGLKLISVHLSGDGELSQGTHTLLSHWFWQLGVQQRGDM